MTCQTVSDLLPLLDDPELGPDEREAVAAHVAACARCAAELAAIRRARQALRPLQAVTVPAGAPERVIAAAHQAKTRRGGSRLWALLGSVPAGGWLAAAAVVALLVLLPVTLPGGRNTAPDVPAPVQLLSAPVEEPARLRGEAFVPSAAVPPPYAEVRTADVDAVVAAILSAQSREVPEGTASVNRRADGSAAVTLFGTGRAWVDGLLEHLAATGAAVTATAPAARVQLEEASGFVVVDVIPLPSEG